MQTVTKTIPDIEFTPAPPEGQMPVLASREAPPINLPEPTSILNVIARAAADPNTDVDKLERLYRLKLDMEAREAKAAYLTALAEMQPELPVITKHGVISKNEKDERGQRTGRQEAMTKYAKWEDVVEGITPVLAKHGFSLSFRVAQPTVERVAISGVLGHKGGHTEETTLALPIDSSGAKNNVQGWGSSVSYGKRYTAFALLNISARGEDDDGHSADSDIEALASGPRDPVTGKPLSTYDVEKAAKAKDKADDLIQAFNLSPNKEAAKEIWSLNWKAPKGSRVSPLGWLQVHATEQFKRVQTAYENVVDLE